MRSDRSRRRSAPDGGASAARPFLSLILEVDTALVHELLFEMDGEAGPAAGPAAPPICLSALDGRFLEAIGEPMDRRIVAPAALREVFYRAL